MAAYTATFLNDITLGAAEPNGLQFENGNVVIKLSDRFEDQLLLHESVLSAASDRFRLRFSSARFAGGREITCPRTGEVIKVYEYHLIGTDKTYCLIDEGDKTSNDFADGITGLHIAFQASDLVDGFARVGQSSFNFDCIEGSKLREEIIFEHKLLFSLLYDLPTHLDPQDSMSNVYSLAEVTALAEYYDFLPKISERIIALLLATPDLWKDIPEQPLFYLLLSIKLRSMDLFADAIRHIVGRAVTYGPQLVYPYELSHYEPDPQPDPEVFDLLQRKELELKERVDKLTKELRLLGLSWYQDHAQNKPRNNGQRVRTTWLAAGLEKKTTEEKCRWVATSIYRELLDQKIFGKPHLSHVQHVHSGGLEDRVKAGSLRIACDAIIEAANSPNGIDLFGKRVASRFAAIFNLRDHRQSKPAELIARQLKGLLNNARKSIEYWLPLKKSDDEYYKKTPYYVSLGTHAKHDEGLEYFTYVGVADFEMPWGDYGKGMEKLDFKPKVQLEPASDEWLGAIGLIMWKRIDGGNEE